MVAATDVAATIDEKTQDEMMCMKTSNARQRRSQIAE